MIGTRSCGSHQGEVMSTAQTGRAHDLHPTASRKPKNPLTRGRRPHMTRTDLQDRLQARFANGLLQRSILHRAMAESSEKLKVFVSYSRRDAIEFAELVAGLELAGFAPFL